MLEPQTEIRIVVPTGDAEPDAALLDDIREYLGHEEAVNTIQLSGFLAVDSFDPHSTTLVARTDLGVVGVAYHAGAFNMLISHIEDPAAIDALAAHIVTHEIEIPGVMGPLEAALAFATRWAAGTTGSFRPGMAQRILATSEVRKPEGVAGTWRHMELADFPLLTTWFAAFGVEADNIPEPDAPAFGEAMLDRFGSRLGPHFGGVLWIDEAGTPVSVACYKAPTVNGVRIGPVYTPPEHRRRGYAGAVTAAATQLMLDRGREFVCLYTNAASTTANHVYEGIGYTFVADSMQYRFTNAG